MVKEEDEEVPKGQPQSIPTVATVDSIDLENNRASSSAAAVGNFANGVASSNGIPEPVQGELSAQNGHETAGPSKLSPPPQQPFSTKVKLMLQGAYRRVTPELIRPSDSPKSTASSTSSAVLRGGVQSDPLVYNLQVTTTNNNLAPESNSGCGMEASPSMGRLCPTHRTGSIDSYEEVCRICHDNGASEPFITPCLCKGTMGLVHQKCLERWLGESGKTTCEICNYEYVTVRVPKYQGFRSICSWIRNPINPHDTKNLFFDIACFFILTPLACVSAWLCVVGSQHYALSSQERYKDSLNSTRWDRYRQIQDASNSTWTSVGLLTLTGTLLTAYYIWLFVAFRYHYQVWRDWQGRNFQVTVLPVSHEATQAQSIPPSDLPRTNNGREWTLIPSPDLNTVVINMDQNDGSSSSSSGGPSSVRQFQVLPMTANVMVNTFNNNLNPDPQLQQQQPIPSTSSQIL